MARPLHLLALAAILAACAALPAAAAPVDVRALGALGDGKADDTPAFLAAVQRAAAEKVPVLVPRGTYRLTRPIVLENAALTGPDPGAWPADIDSLPVLVPAQRDAACVVMKAGASLKGLCIRYEWAKEPDNGPPAVLVSGIGVYISCVKVMYPWDGIMADGETNIGRLNVENVFMVAPRNVGVRVTGTWDVPALRNVEVWNAGPVARGLEKGIGFDLGKNDLIRLTDCFAFAMHVGFLLRDEIPGCKIKGGTWGVLNGCATDYCGYGVEVRGENTVSIAGGTFWEHAESLIVDGDKARVRVSGAELKSNGAPAVVVRRADHVVLSGCSLLRPMADFKAPAVTLAGGRTTITGCHISAQGDGVQLLAGLRSAIVSGCTIEAAGRPIADRRQAGAPGTVVQQGNVEAPLRP